MTFDFDPHLRVELTEHCRREILGHCVRKLTGKYLEGEAREKKAFGLLAGRVGPAVIILEKCLPLKLNARDREPFHSFMNTIMATHASPSETPLPARGWVADPDELARLRSDCQADGMVIAGTYHMHRVGWQQDPSRDTPTKLDAILGAKSRSLMLIVSMVDPSRPIMRAYYEGNPDLELPLETLP